MKHNNIGQDKKVWGDFWENFNPESEIRMWDFYGLRPWILKYTPRYGRVVDAGCGLGRYVFYLSKLGIDIEGVDFHQSTIDFLISWQKTHEFNCKFQARDIKQLGYKNLSMSGYLSLGVMEHFIEGPDEAIAEAFRILRPGGIAIISTPSKSFSYYIQRVLIDSIKRFIKRTIRYPVKSRPFFQYWYTSGELKKFVERNGFYISKTGQADLLYAFYELGGGNGQNINPHSTAVWLANHLENTTMARFGAQSIVIGVNLAENMFCFLCGKLSATPDSLSQFDVPLCESCQENRIANCYLKNKKPHYQLPYTINPQIKEKKFLKCMYCGAEYERNGLFEDYGFTRQVCEFCLKKPIINLVLSNEYVQPIWRNRKTD